MSASHGVEPHDSSARLPSRAPRRGLRPLSAALLLIALIGDLPDVEETGLTKTFEAADASPARGFYRETLGAIVLLVTGIANLLLNGSRREADVTRPGQAAPPGAAGMP